MGFPFVPVVPGPRSSPGNLHPSWWSVGPRVAVVEPCFMIIVFARVRRGIIDIRFFSSKTVPERITAIWGR